MPPETLCQPDKSSANEDCQTLYDRPKLQPGLKTLVSLCCSEGAIHTSPGFHPGLV